jgi:hypothetical protein
MAGSVDTAQATHQLANLHGDAVATQTTTAGTPTPNRHTLAAD